MSEFMYFDPRLKEIYRRQVVNLLNHVNPYTGEKYAEDEAIVTWELNNEEGLTTTSLLYGIGEWPDYFKNELRWQWCQWLVKKYGDEGSLQKAMGGAAGGGIFAGRNGADRPRCAGADGIFGGAGRGSDPLFLRCDEFV